MIDLLSLLSFIFKMKCRVNIVYHKKVPKDPKKEEKPKSLR